MKKLEKSNVVKLRDSQIRGEEQLNGILKEVGEISFSTIENCEQLSEFFLQINSLEIPNFEYLKFLPIGIKSIKELERLIRLNDYNKIFLNSNHYLGPRYPPEHENGEAAFCGFDVMAANNLIAGSLLVRLLRKFAMVEDRKVKSFNLSQDEFRKNNIIANGGISCDLAIHMMGYNIDSMEFEHDCELPYLVDFKEFEGMSLNNLRKLEGQKWRIMDTRATNKAKRYFEPIWEPRNKEPSMTVKDYSLITKIPNREDRTKNKTAWIQFGCHSEGELALSEYVKKSVLFRHYDLFDSMNRMMRERYGKVSPYFQALFSHDYSRRKSGDEPSIYLLDAVPLEEDY